ncbi:NAC domain-containing protein 17-like [Cucurbita pepo subsp. pepo]|uniref:NAC domain-containing protein 17-like n=1 Tax=Cucurbita pepo subsp. pepo TaxID=3664 RepID=UPI000C9D2D6E|nr:NAC domain-containing protein 17-like [Cucurbita pepo subsp. pepo]
MQVFRQSSSYDVNRWPPGVRFYPTDEEIVMQFLKPKICDPKIQSDYVTDIDFYKSEPEELPGLSKLKNGDRLWYFFSPIVLKFGNGAKSVRTTRHGFWKATGKKVLVKSNGRTVGMRRTFVFYKRRASIRERTDWVMHEYTLDEKELKRCPNVQVCYAVCKVREKSGPGPRIGEQYGAPVNDDSVDQVVLVEESEMDSVVLDSQYHSLPRSIETFDSEQQPSKAPESLNLTESDMSQLPPSQTPNAEFVFNVSELASCSGDGDFLEMADFCGPAACLNTENPSGSGNLSYEDLNASMDELDRWHDVETFLKEMGMSLDDLGPSEDDGTVPMAEQNENVNHAANPMDVPLQSIMKSSSQEK